MSQLTINLMNMPRRLERAPLVAEVLHGQQGSTIWLPVSQISPGRVEVATGDYTVRLHTPLGIIKTLATRVLEDKDAEITFTVIPEDLYLHSVYAKTDSDDNRVSFALRFWIHSPYYLDSQVVGPPSCIKTEPEFDRSISLKIANYSYPYLVPYYSDPFSNHLIQLSGPSVPSRFMMLPQHRDIDLTIAWKPVWGEDAIEHQYGRDRIEILARSQFDEAEQLLRFLTAGDLASAESIAGPLIDSLMKDFDEEGVVTNLPGTLICGYFSLQSGWFDSNPRWEDFFTKNASMSADSAAILWWRRLMLGTLDEAQDLREYFIRTATELYLPIYTQGLKLIYDGLRFLVLHAEAGEKETLLSAVSRIEPYAMSADWTQPLTTFYGRAPLEPSNEWVYEERQDGFQGELS